MFLSSIAALSQYGVLDPTFQPGAGADDTVQTVAMQADSKLILGGSFLNYDGVSSKRVVRINPDGSVDNSFNIGSGANNIIHSVVVQPDEKIILAGAFSVFRNTAQKRIVRLNPDGTIDTTFNTALGANDDIFCAYLLPDGKIMVGGIFTSFNWVPRSGLARLNADGSLDETFVPNAPLSTVTEINFLADGKMLINDNSRLLRINDDGSNDPSFYTGAGTDYPIQAVHMLANGKILVGGYFTLYDNQPFNRLLRLNVDGTIDSAFNSETGADYGVLTITEQADGQLLISGLFSHYKGNDVEKVARISPDGDFDPTFDTGMGPDNIVLHHLVQPHDGRVVLVGDFNAYDGAARGRVARISGHLVLSNADQFTANKVTVFPNPANSQLHLHFPEGFVATLVSVADLAGKKIILTSSGLNSFDISHLARGIYLLSVQSDQEELQAKFIKH